MRYPSSDVGHHSTMISLPSAARHGVSTRVEQPALDGGEERGARARDLVLRHDELPERTPDGRIVADAGRDLERRVHAALRDDAVRVDDAQERRRRVPDEVEEVPLAPQLLGMADALADVGAGQHEAEHALAVVHRRQRPGDVDRSAAGSAEEMLLLAARVREHALAERCRVLGQRRRSPRRSGPARCRLVVVVPDPGRPRHRVVEADDPPVEIEDAEERRRRVHDVAHEVALALELVEPGAELRLQAVAVQREPRRDGDRLEQLRLVEQRAVVDDDGDGLAGLARDHRRDALDVVGRHLEGLAVRIDVAVPLFDPGREHDPGIVQRPAQPVLRLLEAGGLAHVEQELRDAAPCEAAAKQPCEEPERNARERDQGDRDEDVLDALVDRAGGEARREEGERSRPGEADRPEHAPRHRRRRAVPHHEQPHDGWRSESRATTFVRRSPPRGRRPACLRRGGQSSCTSRRPRAART